MAAGKTRASARAAKAPAGSGSDARVAITLVRSPNGQSAHQKRVVKGLGFRKLQQTVVRPDTPAIRGMIAKIIHLLTVERHEGGRA
jgi:large subunit ribosomal protein L30